jgi:acyl carrier protein
MRSEKMTMAPSALEHKIRCIVAGKLQLDTTEVPDNKTLTDIGFDSLGLSDLAEAFDEHFGVKMPDRMLPGNITLHELIRLVLGRRTTNGELTDKWRTAEAAD